MKKIKETKYNEWFRNVFLLSFGTCEHKKITEKQGQIFEKYLEEELENWKHSNAYYYSGIISGKKIRLQESSVYNGCTKGHTKTLYKSVYSVTIKEDNTEQEKQIKREIEQLERDFDIAADNSASDAELDKIEDKIDDLYDKLKELRF